MHDFSQQLPVVEQSPVEPGFVQDPFTFYAFLRTIGDLVLWKDYGLPVATTHAAVMEVLQHPKIGRVMPGAHPHALDARHAAPDVPEARTLLELAPPAQIRVQREIARVVQTEQIALVAPLLSQAADHLIDAFPDGEFDLIGAFARPFSAQAVARLLGLEKAHRDTLHQATRDIFAGNAGTTELSNLLSGELTDRRRRPRGDLLSRLAQSVERGRLSEAEATSALSLLVIAGQENLCDAIGNAVGLVSDRADRRVALQPEAIAGTVEETLRFRPPVHLFIGRAHAPVTIEHVTIPEGGTVGCLLGSACRDDSVWPDADRFDPFRIGRGHLAFGDGPHACAGSPLVRLGLQIALPVLYARCPTLTVTTAPRVAARFPFHGFERLMVRVRSAEPRST